MKPVQGKVLFAGGGTGGHIYPALATIEALKKEGEFEILYVGGYAGLENEIVPPLGIPFRRIWISGFLRQWTLRNLLFPAKLLVSLWQSYRILREFQPDVVVGTGGYVSGPVVYLAARQGIPTLIQEQDSYPGVTTRLLSRYADVLCTPYPEVAEHLPRLKGRLQITGNPVRSSLRLIPREEAIQRWRLNPEKPVVLVFGGSQGARALNQAVAQLVPEMAETFQAQFLWQTGKKLFAEVQQHMASRHPAVRLLPYIEDMGAAYSAADVIISRAGAITLAELSQVQKACILVPYPYAAANHQQHNAEAVQRKGAAIVVLEGERFVQRLRQELQRLLQDANLRRKMGEAWRAFYKPRAAREIAGIILELMGRNVHNQTEKGQEK